MLIRTFNCLKTFCATYGRTCRYYAALAITNVAFFIVDANYGAGSSFKSTFYFCGDIYVRMLYLIFFVKFGEGIMGWKILRMYGSGVIGLWIQLYVIFAQSEPSIWRSVWLMMPTLSSFSFVQVLVPPYKSERNEISRQMMEPFVFTPVILFCIERALVGSRSLRYGKAWTLFEGLYVWLGMASLYFLLPSSQSMYGSVTARNLIPHIGGFVGLWTMHGAWHYYFSWFSSDNRALLGWVVATIYFFGVSVYGKPFGWQAVHHEWSIRRARWLVRRAEWLDDIDGDIHLNRYTDKKPALVMEEKKVLTDHSAV